MTRKDKIAFLKQVMTGAKNIADLKDGHAVIIRQANGNYIVTVHSGVLNEQQLEGYTKDMKVIILLPDDRRLTTSVNSIV